MSQEQKVKRTQYIIAGLLLLGIVLLILVLISYFEQPKTTQRHSAKDAGSTVNLTTANNKIDPQTVWRSKMEDEQDRIKDETRKLQNLIKDYQKEADTNQNELKSLLQQLALEKNEPVPNQVASFNESQNIPESKITKFSLHLDPHQNKALTTVDNTIPAGTFARAVLLSGVDAVTAVNIKADPRPMLLRIIDFGNMPRKFTTDLVDCHCTAAAWGELSSERVHTRIEKLSCIERATGEILEIPAQGYLAGSDGREGIRGVVVSKDGQFLNKSLWGGVFAGIGSVLSPASRRAQGGPFISIGPDQPKMSTNDMFKTGFGESANTSLNKLAQYYIARAEQIQPVIQVAAGQEVDVIFTEGFAIDQSQLKRKTATINDVQRKQTIEQQEVQND